jgi:hypothetical protein
MQNKDTTPAVAQKPARERVGLVVSGTNAAEAVSTIVAAEAAGVRQTWMIQTPRTPILISALRQGAFQLAGEIAVRMVR